MALNQIMYPGFAAYHIGLKSSVKEAADPEDIMPEEMIDGAPMEEELVEEEDLANSEEPVASPPTEFSDQPEPIEEETPASIEDMELPTAENE